MSNDVNAVMAKMRCNSVETTKWGKFDGQQYMKVKLGAIYGTEGENAAFTKATPCGECWMQIDASAPAAQFFDPQDDYYVTFTKVPKKEQ